MVYLVYLIFIALSTQKIYLVYKVIIMKKTEYITYRTDIKIRNILKKLSDEKKWSLSQLSEEIIREWLTEKYPELLQDET